MNTIELPARSPSLFMTSVCSLLVHFMVLVLLLTISIYSGGASYGSSGGGYSVYLSNEVHAARTGRPQRAAVAQTENSSEAVGKSTEPVEEHAQSNPQQFDKEEAPMTEQTGRESEVDEAPFVQELLPASSPEGTGQSPVPEENGVKQEAAENWKIAQPASQDKAEKVEKVDLSEKTLLVARNVLENTASESDQIKKSEKKPDTAEKPPTSIDAKAVMAAVQAASVAPETRKEVTVPSSMKENISQDVHGTQESMPPVLSEKEKTGDHKKNAGEEKPVVSAPKQTIQKSDEAGETHHDQLKNEPDAAPKSVGMGSQKPDRELQASGGENISRMKLTGSEPGKNRAALHLESKLPGQSESALAGSPEGLPAKGTEDRQMQPAAVEGLANAGGSEAKVSSDIRNQPQSVKNKTSESQSIVPADTQNEVDKSGIGIPASEALIQKDIRIEVFMEDPDMAEILTKLFRKTHPQMRRSRDRERQEPVEGTVKKTISILNGPDKTGARHLFSLAKAEKAAYTFVLENKGEQTRTVNVFFRFYEGREKQRDKEYSGRELVPGGMLRFTFIMPEGIFWDDEDRFSGRVEDSRTITKFDYESGLVWKEEKGSIP